MTTAELKTPTGFDVEWAARAEALAARSGEPAWALERRRAAAAIAGSLSFPSREHELWRRTDFRTLNAELERLDPFLPAVAVADPSALPAALRAQAEEDTALVVQWNGDVVLERTPEALKRQGVVVSGLDRAAREHGPRLEAHLGAMLEDSYDWYTAFGGAVRSGGAFVYVPDGVEAALPIRLLHWMDRGGAVAAPRTVVVLGRGARATVIEEQRSDMAERTSFHLGGTEAFLGDESKLIFATHQDWSRNVYHYSNQRARLGRGCGGDESGE